MSAIRFGFKVRRSMAARIEPEARGGGDVAGVGGQDLARAPVECLGRAAQPAVLGRAAGEGQPPRGDPGTLGERPAFRGEVVGRAGRRFVAFFHVRFRPDHLAHGASSQP